MEKVNPRPTDLPIIRDTHLNSQKKLQLGIKSSPNKGY